MVKQNVSDEALRQLDFEARDIMEDAVAELDLEIIKAYQQAQIGIFDRLRSFNRKYPAGSDFESRKTQRKYRKLKRQVEEEIERLGDIVEKATLDAKKLGLDKAKLVTTDSASLIAAGAVHWGDFLNASARQLIDSGLLLEQYPSSVKKYKDLFAYFNRDQYEYFKNLEQQPGFLDRYARIRRPRPFILGDIDHLMDATWSPIAQLRRIFGRAQAERMSYGQLVTIIRREVWRLAPYSRSPIVTYHATRLARTEMIRTAAMSQNAWARRTPGIQGVRRYFGGGACNGICLQYVGYWRFDREGHPEPIPVHPHCGCYETFETDVNAGQHTQDVMLLDNGTYMDGMTYRHDSILAARVGEDLPDIVQRYELQGSSRYVVPRRAGALRENIQSRLTAIN